MSDLNFIELGGNPQDKQAPRRNSKKDDKELKQTTRKNSEKEDELFVGLGKGPENNLTRGNSYVFPKSNSESSFRVNIMAENKTEPKKKGMSLYFGSRESKGEKNNNSNIDDYRPVDDGETFGGRGGGRGGDGGRKRKSDDKFYQDLYSYYHAGGFYTILLLRFARLISIIFGLSFILFSSLVLDWPRLLQCGRDNTIEDTALLDCGEWYDYINNFNWDINLLIKSINLFQWTVIGFVAFGCIFLLYELFHFIPKLCTLFRTKSYYEKTLKITPRELDTMTWSNVVNLISMSKNNDEMSIHDITNCIMRRENYLIAMLNQGIIKLPTISFCGLTYEIPLTNQIEKNIEWIVLDQIFDEDLSISITNDKITRRMFYLAILNAIAAPFMFVYLLMFFFVSNIEDWQTNKNYLGPRRFSLEAKWKFREFNELSHFFNARLNAALTPANEYTKQFPNPFMDVLGKFVSLISGAFVALFVVFSVVDESILLYVKGPWGRALFFYAGVFTLISSISRGIIRPPETSVYNPHGVLKTVYKYTHHMPIGWKDKESTYDTRDEFLKLFKFKNILFIEDLFSVFLTPLVLGFLCCYPSDSLSSQASRIAHFIQANSVSAPHVGNICNFADFDLKKNGNKLYASPAEETRVATTNDGKMEKSFISFVVNHPEWKGWTEDNKGGKDLFTKLATFQEEQSRQMGLGTSSLLMDSSQPAPLTMSVDRSLPNLPNGKKSMRAFLNESLYSDPSLLMPLDLPFKNNANDLRASSSEKYLIWLEKHFAQELNSVGAFGDSNSSL